MKQRNELSTRTSKSNYRCALFRVDGVDSVESIILILIFSFYITMTMLRLVMLTLYLKHYYVSGIISINALVALYLRLYYVRFSNNC